MDWPWIDYIAIIVDGMSDMIIDFRVGLGLF